MGITSTTRNDIWSEDNSEIPNYPTSTYGGRHFKPHSDDPQPTHGGRHFKPYSDNPQPTYGGRHFKPHSYNPTPTYRGRHFKPQDIEPSDPSKTAHITRGRHFKPPHLEIDNLVEALNKATQQKSNEEDEVLKQL